MTLTLIAPIKTEKAISKIESENSLTFQVSPEATKQAVWDDVEKTFNVKVVSVRTFITPRGKKHAIVRLDKTFKADDVAVKLKMVA